MKLIDADALLKEFEEWNADLQADSILYSLATTDRQLGMTDAIVIACQMPTIDAIPIDWIYEWINKHSNSCVETELYSMLVDWRKHNIEMEEE